MDSVSVPFTSTVLHQGRFAWLYVLLQVRCDCVVRYQHQPALHAFLLRYCEIKFERIFNESKARGRTEYGTELVKLPSGERPQERRNTSSKDLVDNDSRLSKSSALDGILEYDDDLHQGHLLNCTLS